MKDYYECHVTIESKDPIYTELQVNSLGWKYSSIDGDPVLGKGVKCYATKQFNATKNKLEEVIAFVHFAADSIDGETSKVLRRKVELVVYDDRAPRIS